MKAHDWRFEIEHRPNHPSPLRYRWIADNGQRRRYGMWRFSEAEARQAAYDSGALTISDPLPPPDPDPAMF